MIKEPFGISDACNKKILLPLLFIIHFGLVASHLQSVKIFFEGAQDFCPVLSLPNVLTRELIKGINQGNVSKGIEKNIQWNLHCKSF